MWRSRTWWTITDHRETLKILGNLNGSYLKFSLRKWRIAVSRASVDALESNELSRRATVGGLRGDALICRVRLGRAGFAVNRVQAVAFGVLYWAIYDAGWLGVRLGSLLASFGLFGSLISRLDCRTRGIREHSHLKLHPLGWTKFLEIKHEAGQSAGVKHGCRTTLTGIREPCE